MMKDLILYRYDTSVGRRDTNCIELFTFRVGLVSMVTMATPNGHSPATSKLIMLKRLWRTILKCILKKHENVYWINLAHYTDQWEVLLNAINNIQLHER